MSRLRIVLVFISLFLWRWTSLESPLPPTWTPKSVVRFTAPIIDHPEQTDTKTIVRKGMWYIPLKGYAAITPGDLVTFSGTVEPRVQLGKITQIIMVDPTFEIVATKAERSPRLIENIWLILGTWREKWVAMLSKWLPEPMSSLAAGILLGVRAHMPQDFYESLVATGTMHIVAASGYNVSIILAVVLRVTLTMVSRTWAIVIGIAVVFAYVVVAGAGASIVRAGVMGSLSIIAYYFGRAAQAKRLLWVTAGLMLFAQPLMMVDIGFQLSVAATAGLLYLEPYIRRRLEGLVQRSATFKSYLADYLYPTLAATVSTLPVIVWHFGRVSWISPLVNLLVLPLVSVIMALSAVAITVGMVVPQLGQLLAWILYPALWWMVGVIDLFGKRM